jgi:type II secretory pathway pseudopilin PulG
MKCQRETRNGFTLVEAVLGVAIMAIVSVAGVIAANRGVGAYETARMTTSVEQKVQRALQRAARELMPSSLGVVTPPNLDDQFGSSDITFAQAIGYDQATETILWGPVTRLRFEYERGEIDDGIDNNGNGIADEGILVMIRDDGGPNETRSVLCSNVREFLEGEEDNNADDNGNLIEDEAGFNVHQEGDVLTLRLTIEETSDKIMGSIVRTLTTSVRLRN